MFYKTTNLFFSVCESVTPIKRSRVAVVVVNITNAIGFMGLAPLAYAVQSDWRYLQIVCCTPVLLFLPMLW